LKFTYLQNYTADYNQILHNDKDHRLRIVDGLSKHRTNPRWRTAAILKNKKWPYLCNTLTDLHKIWHDDSYWPSEGYGQLKFPTFKNPRWRTAAILKNGQRPYLSKGLTDPHEMTVGIRKLESLGYHVALFA